MVKVLALLGVLSAPWQFSELTYSFIEDFTQRRVINIVDPEVISLFGVVTVRKPGLDVCEQKMAVEKGAFFTNRLNSACPRDSRFDNRAVNMSDLFWLNDSQMACLEPFFLKSHGKPRVDDRRVLSGIIFINRNGLRRRDGENVNAIGSREHADAACGPHKTLYNRWKRWSDKGIFARMMAGLAADHGED